MVYDWVFNSQCFSVSPDRLRYLRIITLSRVLLAINISTGNLKGRPGAVRTIYTHLYEPILMGNWGGYHLSSLLYPLLSSDQPVSSLGFKFCYKRNKADLKEFIFNWTNPNLSLPLLSREMSFLFLVYVSASISIFGCSWS